MSTFEIQVYKGGNWNVDSYFDDREIAMSEAERLNGTGRHAGVRILQEDYDVSSNKSSCRVVFSKTLQSDENQEWRVRAKHAPAARNSAAKAGSVRPNRRRPSAKRSNTRFYLGLVVAFIVLIAGIAALIGLQEIAKTL